jgi:hypothetical protein
MLKDHKSLQQFKAIEKMSEWDKEVFRTLIVAFISKRKLKQLALSQIKPGTVVGIVVYLAILVESHLVFWDCYP